jgi:hypothetical protein
VHSGDQEGIGVGGVDLAEAVVVAATAVSVAEGIEMGFADEQVVLGAVSVGDTEGVQSPGIVLADLQALPAEVHGPLDGLDEAFLFVGRHIEFGAFEEGVVAGDEFGGHAAGEEEAAVEEAVGEMVPGFGVLRVPGGFALEQGEGAVVIEAIESVVSL